MSAFSLIKQSDASYFIEGKLTFSAINKKTINAFDFSKATKKICFDLEKVTDTDSAGLALIIEWIKQCKLHKTKLTFKNIPQQLFTLANLSDFDLQEFSSDL